MVCYRRRGHNEGDDPSMTQPLMYNLIEAKRSVRKLYTESLIGRGDISQEDAEAALRDYQQQLERVFVETKAALKEAEPRRPATPRWPAPTPRATPASSRRPPRRTDQRRPARPSETAISAEHAASTSATRSSNPPRGLHRPPQAAADAWRSARQSTREGGIDWAHRRAAGLRVAAHGGHPGAPRRPGQPPRHLRPAPRGAHRQAHRRGVDAAALPRRGPGPVLGLRLAAVRVRGDGLRVRLLRRASRRPRAVGGAVRRLRQRRPDDHRRVHLAPRSRSGASARRSCCCSRTATRARARTTPRPASSASCRCAPRTT